jgi:uncharacterized protein DUF397
MNSTEQPAWRRSRGCSNGTCVEIAAVDGGYLIRDSKNPEQAPLRFTEEELTVFAAAFAAGEFRSE